jgi:hypothetical protein
VPGANAAAIMAANDAAANASGTFRTILARLNVLIVKTANLLKTATSLWPALKVAAVPAGLMAVGMFAGQQDLEGNKGDDIKWPGMSDTGTTPALGTGQDPAQGTGTGQDPSQGVTT